MQEVKNEVSIKNNGIVTTFGYNRQYRADDIILER